LVLCDSRVTFLGPGGPVHYLTLTSCSLSWKVYLLEIRMGSVKITKESVHSSWLL
jgi:hypothetical protein